MNIVVFKLSPLGDTVMFLPVVQTLQKLQPGWQVTVVTTPGHAGLFRGTISSPDLLLIESNDLKRAWSRPWRMLSWWRQMRRLRPDGVLLSCDQSSVAHMLAGMSGARVRVAGAGSVVRWRRGLTHTIEKSPPHTIAEWDWTIAGAMMAALGAGWPETPPPPPLLPLRKPTSPRASRPRVVIHAGASRAYQCWLPERFAALAAVLARDCEVRWVVRSEITVSVPPGVQAVECPRVENLIELIAEADLFVGNHSGPFHLAAALGRPCVVPTGPTFPACDPPWHRERLEFLRAPGLACLPCDHLTQGANHCRNTANPMACMKHWTVEAVEAACRDLLRRFPSSNISF